MQVILYKRNYSLREPPKLKGQKEVIFNLLDQPQALHDLYDKLEGDMLKPSVRRCLGEMVKKEYIEEFRQ